MLDHYTAAPPQRRHYGPCARRAMIAHFRCTKAADTPHGAAHLAIAKNWVMAGPKRVHSRWNQGWDVGSPMLGVMGVNTRDLQTIEVLDIPPGYPITSGPEYVGLHRNFREHIRQLESAEGSDQ